jgi:hypothetical protein
VFYSLSGTALNGVDYRELSGRLTIPIGASSARLVVDPIDDQLVEGVETVVVTIDPPVCIAIFPPPSDCYVVGTNSHARAVILDNDQASTNQPPRVAIRQPMDGDIFPAQADIRLCAEAKDGDGFVRTVEFFADGKSLGVVSNGLGVIRVDTIQLVDQIFCLVWSNVPAGSYELTAKATDNDGAMSFSDPVHINVLPPCALPVVTIQATDKIATEQSPLVAVIPDTATFRVSRSCRTNEDLRVRYAIGGTASNGEDYRKLDGVVLIPAGSEWGTIVVDPIDDDRIEGTETVEITLLPSICLVVDPSSQDCYIVGAPSRDVVFIRDNETFPPKVAIVRPENGDKFKEGADIGIVAQAADADGWVQRVDFFADGKLIGFQEVYFIIPPPPGQLQRFSMVWSNAPLGRHALTAKATDDRGATSESGLVWIEVVDTPPPPVVNVFAIDAFAREGLPLNTATFRIRRSGETNAALTVHYALRGMAVNGVDYELLPDTVTIPAGRRTARVVIVPIDDRLVERIETVVLRLEESALYTVGRWGRAAAIIVDNDLPRPGNLCLADKLFHLRAPGTNGTCYRVQFSSNFVDWEVTEANLVTDDAIHFVDPEAPDFSMRFYRVLPVSEVDIFDEE